MRNTLRVALALLSILAVAGPSAPADLDGGGPAGVAPAPPAPPQGLSAASWQSISEQIRRDRYRVATDRVEPAGGPHPALVAANPAQSYRVRFDADGIRVRLRDSASDFALRLTRWGYEGDLRPAAPAAPRADGARVSYLRGPLTEWYVNRPEGLEQGFTVASPPAGSSDRPLVVEMALSGTLAARRAGAGLELVDAGGGTVLRYGGLAAWDAGGRTLAARMALVSGALRIEVDDRGAAYPLTIDPIVETAKLTAHDPASGDQFGWAVAISGDRVVVGAPDDDDDKGSAYVFTRNGSSWSEPEKLTVTGDDRAFGDKFGSAVAISGDTVVVGAPDDDTFCGSHLPIPCHDAGAAYVFTRSGSSWQQEQKLALEEPEEAAAEQFGWAVAVSGDTVVVGARRDPEAYVFTRSGSTWSEQQRLTGDAADQDNFGRSVAVSGDTVVIGAPNVDDSESAYVFTRSGSTWSLQKKLTAAEPAAGDQFGYAVAISGDMVVVGVPFEESTGSDSGSAYVFTRSGSTWWQIGELPVGVAGSPWFGRAVTISGDMVVVGDPVADRAYVFTRSGSTWLHENLARPGWFGGAVAISGDTVVVGTPFDDDGGLNNSGAAYVFAIPPCSDIDRDGWGDPGTLRCPTGPETDCDDFRAHIYPGAPEICDGRDDDCDGESDEDFPDTDGDGVGDPCDLCQGDDATGDGDSDGYCSDTDCDDTNAEINPGAAEICDGVDNDCDGVSDEGFGDADGDGVGDPCDLCYGDNATGDLDGDGYCSDTDCDDFNGNFYPGAPELCDGRDNDCDGETDEVFPDADGDGVGDPCDLCQGDDITGDEDGDGYCNDTDNCPRRSNPDQDELITVVVPAVTTGTFGEPYSESFGQLGGTDPTTYTTADPLPAGFTLLPAGVLSGTPAGPGTWPIQVTATDPDACTGTGLYTLTIGNVSVTNPAPTAGPPGSPIAPRTFTASGGSAPYTFSIVVGTLPAGLDLDPVTGVLSGTPTETGSFQIRVQATDAGGDAGTGGTYSLVIVCPGITVTPPAVTTGTLGESFNEAFTQSGGIGATTFEVASGTLPAGLTLLADGTVSGTPTEPGSFPVSARATDAYGCTATSATYPLEIECQAIAVIPPAVTAGLIGAPFSGTFFEVDAVGTAAFSTASTLPGGLALSPAGVLDGTPTVERCIEPLTPAPEVAGSAFAIATAELKLDAHLDLVTAEPGGFRALHGDGNGGFVSSFLSVAGTYPSLAAANFIDDGENRDDVVAVDLNQHQLLLIETHTTGQLIGVRGTFPLDAGSPVGVAAGDFNGDGRPDVVTANHQFGVSILLNTGSWFGSPLNYPTTADNSNIQAHTVAVGHFNADSFLDVVVAGSWDASLGVVVFFGHGDGTLATPGTIDLGLNISAIALGHFDNNGWLDLAATHTNGVTVLSGCGGGCGFQSPVTYNLPAGSSVAIGDFNQDGHQDLAVPQSSRIAVLFGNGDLTFQPPLPSAAGPDPRALVGGEFNSDGKDDVASANGTGVSSWLGTYECFPNEGTYPIAVTATDANGCTGTDDTYTLTIDPCPVITVTNPAVTTGVIDSPFDQDFTVSGGTPPLTFSLASGALPPGLTLFADGNVSGTPTQLGSFPVSVTATDASGCSATGATYPLTIDVCPQIAVTNPAVTTGTIGSPFDEDFTVSGGTPPLTFSLASGALPPGLTLSASGNVSGIPTALGSFPVSATATDASACTGTGATYPLEVRCPEIVVTPPAFPFAVIGEPFSETYSQAGGQGATTFATESLLPAGLDLSPAGLLSGTPAVERCLDPLTAQPEYFLAGGFAHAVATAELKLDAHLDLVTAETGGFGALHGDGNGGFQEFFFSVPGSHTYIALAVANFIDDGENRDDFVAVDLNQHNLVLFETLTSGQLIGPRGTFPLDAGSPLDVAAGDFNGDGRPDVVTANNQFGVSILLNTGGSFGSPLNYPTTADNSNFHAGSVAVGHFNADSFLDVVATGSWGASLGVVFFFGHGDGTLATPGTIDLGLNISAIALGHFDNIGWPDLAATHTNGVTVLSGCGGGCGFQSPVTYNLPADPSVAIGDFNQDGHQDLAVPQSLGIAVLYGNGDGTFQPPLPLATGPDPRALVAGDFNNDDEDDVLSANGNSVSSWLNTYGCLSNEGDYPIAVTATDANGCSGTDDTYTLGVFEVLPNVPPTLTVTEPDGIGDVVDASFTIRWTDDDPDEDASISLYYDSDNMGADGVPIASGLTEDPDGAGNDDFLWDTTVVADGAYFIYALIDDGVNPPVVAYSAGPVTVLSSQTVDFTAASQSNDESVAGVTVTAQLSALSGVAVAVPVTFAGSAVDPADYSPSTATITIPAGMLSAEATLSVVDDALDEADETVVVTMGTPVNAMAGTVTVHTATIVDNDPEPTVGFTAASQLNPESTTTVAVTAQLSALSGKQVEVPVNLAGTAVDPDDYTPGGSTITIPAGQLSADLTLTVVDDGMDEPTEVMDVAMGVPVNAGAAGILFHTAAISDDDPPPVVELTTGFQSNVESVTPVTVTAQLSALSAFDVQVPVSFGGTAVDPDDYTPSGSTIAIPAGQLSADLTLAVVDDALDEGSELIDVTMGVPVNATPGATTVHTVLIQDNDAPPVVDFASASQSNAESVSPVTVTVQLSAVSGQAVQVPVTFGGTAGEPGDYSPSTATITVPAGQTSADLTLTVVDDGDNENDETVVVRMGVPTGAAPGATTVHTATIEDDEGPSITVLEPDGFGDLADAGFTIMWTDADPNDDAAIDLFYDTDNTGEDGTAIASGLSEDPDGAGAGNDDFPWDTSGIPGGDYFVYAVIDDGFQTVVDYSDGPVTVNHPPTIALLQPDGVNDTADSEFLIVWDDADAEDDAAIDLYYDVDASGEDGTFITSFNEDPDGLADRHLWDTSLLADGSYFVYAVIDDGVNPPVTEYGSGPFTVDHTEVPCGPPASGDWTVSASCTMIASDTAPANVIVSPGVVLTIDNGVTLSIDLVNYKLEVQAGGGVLVRALGAIRQP